MSIHIGRFASRICSLVALGGMLFVTVAGAQARATPRQSMALEAKVSRDAARMTAVSKVPGGRVSSVELQRGPAGKLIYVAILTETGKPVKTEVIIDAMTGAVISKRP